MKTNEEPWECILELKKYACDDCRRELHKGDTVAARKNGNIVCWGGCPAPTVRPAGTVLFL